jgi:hypothetical protein
MIRTFRKLRAGLLEQKQISRYILYAVGEILLVIIGILIAIQVDNWNNERKERSQLHATLDQVYTVFDRDLDRLIALKTGYLEQVSMIDSIISNSRGINPKLLPHMLYYIDLAYGSLTTEVSNVVKSLNLDPDDIQQRNLGKAISEYERNFQVVTYYDKKYLTPLLEQYKLSEPSLTFQYSNLNNFKNVDWDFFDDEEIRIVQQLMDDPLLRRALKSCLNEKMRNINILDFNIDIIKTKKLAVEEYYPDVILLYRNISLIGSGTGLMDWEKDVPLLPIDKAKTIWESDVDLKGGFVKFREGGDWTLNWGGKGFPEGNAIWYGDNIEVDEGRYHVTFNLNDRTYQFTKIVP